MVCHKVVGAVEHETIRVALIRQRIILENQRGCRKDLIRRDGVVGEGRSVEISHDDRVTAAVGYTVEVAIPHGLGGHSLMDGRLRPIPHPLVVNEEEGVILEDGAAQRKTESVGALGRLTSK